MDKPKTAKDLIKIIEEWLYSEPAGHCGSFEHKLFDLVEKVKYPNKSLGCG